MSKREILSYLLSSNSTLSTKEIIISLAVAVLLSLFMYWVYKKTYSGVVYSKNFNVTLVLVAIITTVIMLVIGSNLALSLGMVGSLSIIRFRTAVKEPRDIAFLFWSIAAGIVLAAGMIPLAVIGSVVIGIILLVFVNKKSHTNPYIVVIQCNDHEVEKKATAYLKEKCNRCVIKSKSVRRGSVEMNLEIRLKDDNTDFINELSDMNGINSAVLVSYNGDYMG